MGFSSKDQKNLVKVAKKYKNKSLDDIMDEVLKTAKSEGIIFTYEDMKEFFYHKDVVKLKIIFQESNEKKLAEKVKDNQKNNSNNDNNNPNWTDEEKKIKDNQDGGINGFEAAKNILLGITKLNEAKPKEFQESFKALVNDIDGGNMFSQHDEDYCRYDVQDPTKGFTNLQIQLGGKKAYLGNNEKAKKTSLTAVLVDDRIVKLCSENKDIGDEFAKKMKKYHNKSFEDGKVIKVTYDEK